MFDMESKGKNNKKNFIEFYWIIPFHNRIECQETDPQVREMKMSGGIYIWANKFLYFLSMPSSIGVAINTFFSCVASSPKVTIKLE